MARDQAIEHEERVRLLKEKSVREGIDVPDDVLEYIAEQHASSYSLKAALVYLITMSRRRECDIDIVFTREVFGEDEEQAEENASIQATLTAASAPKANAASENYHRSVIPEPPVLPLPVPEPAKVQSPEPTPAPTPTPTLVPDVESHSTDVGTVTEWNGQASQGEPDLADGSEYATEWGPEQDGIDEQPRLHFDEPAEEEPHVASEPEPVYVASHEATPTPTATQPPTPASIPTPAPLRTFGSSHEQDASAKVYFTPMRTTSKRSLVKRAGQLLQRAGLSSAVEEDDLVAVKLHFGEEGNTGYVHPIYLREVVAKIKERGGKPFLTDSNTLYRGERSNSPDHITCALHNGFTYATVEAPIIIADGLDGRDATDVEIAGGHHFESVRIGSAAVHADALVVVTHVKGHEAAGFGGALKNVGMGLGCRSAKQRMHADFLPDPDPEKCTACGRCVKWCPVDAITIGPDRVATVDYEPCYGCGECVAACPHGAISIEWKTEPEAIQEKIVEHVAGAVADKEGKTVYLSFVTNVSPDCDCWHFSDAAVVPDIGVLASTDPVAIDQAAYDLVTQAPGLAGTRGEGMGAGDDKFTEITGIDGTHAMKHAEALGLGVRKYELITLE